MGTRYDGTTEQKRALSTFIKLSRASETIHGHLYPLLSRHQLTNGQFGVMEALFHLGEMAQVDIGRKLLRSPGNVTVVLDNLERRGFIIRKRDNRDRRRLIVRLTDKGHHLIADIMPDHISEILRSFSCLDAAEQEELGRLCKKLGFAVSMLK